MEIAHIDFLRTWGAGNWKYLRKPPVGPTDRVAGHNVTGQAWPPHQGHHLNIYKEPTLPREAIEIGAIGLCYTTFQVAT